MLRRITGFHQDDAGDWVAELSCLHRQHVRHRPPFVERPWVLTASGRQERVGTDIDCPLCTRAELPDGLRLVRTAGPFTNDTLPQGLRRTHRVAEATWGRLHVIQGAVGIWMGTDPPFETHLGAGDRQAIPPQVPHRLLIDVPVVLAVDFLTPARDEIT